MARPPVLPGTRPDWLKIRVPAPEVVAEVEGLIRSKGLVTVCEEARCPNLHECWGGAPDRDLHAAGRGLHAPLRLLQRG